MIKEYYDETFFLTFNKFILQNNPFSRNFVYIENDIIYGFINFSVLYERVELNYIWVDEKYRNNGIASKLMLFLINEVEHKQNITLEVSIDNINAIKLYKKYGFKEVAKREKYYDGIDALLMIREMK